MYNIIRYLKLQKTLIGSVKWPKKPCKKQLFSATVKQSKVLNY